MFCAHQTKPNIPPAPRSRISSPFFHTAMALQHVFGRDAGARQQLGGGAVRFRSRALSARRGFQLFGQLLDARLEVHDLEEAIKRDSDNAPTRSDASQENLRHHVCVKAMKLSKAQQSKE